MRGAAARCWVPVALGLVLCAGAAGQSALERPVTLSRLDGLSHNTVHALLQDRRGFLWVGTADGLDRYDGYEFVVYRHDPRDPTSLASSTINALAEDAAGTLWIGTDAGLHRRDPVTGRFVRYALGSARQPERISELKVDGEGRLWAQSFSDPGGVYRYDPAAGRFVRHAVTGTNAEGEAEAHIVVDHRGGVWGLAEAGRPAGLLRYDGHSGRFVPSGSFPRSPASVRIRAGRASTWACGAGGMERVDLGAGRVEPLAALDPPSADCHPLEALDGTLWLGTETGLRRVDPRTGAVQAFPVDTTGTAGLGNHVLALAEGRTGILWVGTRGGLFRYDPNAKPFVHLAPGAGLPRHPGSGAVMAVAEAAGSLWVGTLGGGLLRLDPPTGAAATFRHDPRDPHSLPDDRVWALYAEGGRLWVGTEAGLSVLDVGSGRFTAVPLPRPRTSGYGPGSPAIYALAPGPDGALWALGPSDVYRLDPARARVAWNAFLAPLLHATAQAVLPSAATPGVLWIGTEGRGLFRYDPSAGPGRAPGAGALTRYPTGARDAAGLPGQTVLAIAEDLDGRLWLGTDLGLVRFDPSTGAFDLHYEPAALPGAFVYSLLRDGAGRLWMGTSRGLARFDPATGALRHYGLSDGVGQVEFNRRAALRRADGTLVFGGLDGLTAFRPEAIRDNPHPPPVVITRLDVFDGRGARSLFPQPGDAIHLGPRENTFEVAFAALGFTDPERNRYAYRLEGFDDDWVAAGGRRLARYTRLPPGDYVFRVRAANNDGVWNEEGAMLRLSLAPSYWATWWFRLLAGGLLAGLGVTAYRARIAQVRRVERLRLRIAADLHDDVGSRLSSIALLSEMVRDRAPLPEPERDELTRVGAEARRLVDVLREIVWFVDPEHERPGALAEKMRETAARLLPAVPHAVDVPEHLALDAADAAVRRDVFLIFKEALHNAARHAGAGRVTISLRDDGAATVLTVADDGRGFGPERGAAGHGLRTMRRRAEGIGATLAVESRPGGGTTVRLTVPN